MLYQMGESILDGYDVDDVVLRSKARRFSGSNPDGTHYSINAEWRMTLVVRRNISIVFLKDLTKKPRLIEQFGSNLISQLLQDKYRQQQQQQFKRPDDHPNVVTATQGAMPPLLSTPRDCGPSEISETMLCGEPISCFSVGGEFRLCLPQVMSQLYCLSPLVIFSQFKNSGQGISELLNTYFSDNL